MSKVISELLWFCITALSDWFKVLAPLFQPIRSETKTIVARACTFSRALCRLCVITSSFDWFTGLSPSFLIGQSNLGCRDGAVVRALAFHQCGPGSIPGLGVICGLSLLVLYSAQSGFLRVLRFPLSSKTNI